MAASAAAAHPDNIGLIATVHGGHEYKESKMAGSASIKPANKFKLGVFGTNMDSGLTATKIPERYRLTWPNVEKVAKLADKAGIETNLSMMRWQSLGGETDFHSGSYETFTWAAGVSSVTEHAQVVATMHIFAVHPIVAAKQMAMVDHISNGRFGFNLVCGWFPPEYEMFGVDMPEHDKRYAYAAEWLEIVQRMWTADEPFDYNGEFFRLKNVRMDPKPIRTPKIMNAGGSETGAHFAAEHADMAFIGVLEHETDEQRRAKVDKLRFLARDKFNRDIEVWSGIWFLCRPTQKEAQEEYRRVLIEQGDFGTIGNLPPAVVPDFSKMSPEEAEQAKAKLLAGFGSIHLVGTPEQIADGLESLIKIGLDGLVLTCVNYLDDLPVFISDVLPILETRGLRQPASA